MARDTRDGRAGVLRTVPFNVASALLVIAAAFARGTAAEYWPRSAVTLVQLVTLYLTGVANFRIEPAHFVERRRLPMLMPFGESVVAIGIGAAGPPLVSGVIAAAVLGLALASCLWWAYFTGDSERAEHALRTAAPESRARSAIEGFFYAHIPMLLT